MATHPLECSKSCVKTKADRLTHHYNEALQIGIISVLFIQ